MVCISGARSWSNGFARIPAVAGKSVQRPDIEGLRAVAVVAVLAFHTGLGVNGGFAGVDAFFGHSSGYLITRQIAAEMRNGSFSLAAFLERRVMRIMPALLAMLSVSALFACILFMPPELMLFGRSLVLSVLSVSNFGFWLESGYFDVSAQVKPLLHTWSLGIEWQFYLLLPLLFLAAGHRRASWVQAGHRALVRRLRRKRNDVGHGKSGSVVFPAAQARFWNWARVACSHFRRR